MAHLTVKQLIKELQQCPPNAKVYRADHDHGMYETAGSIGEVNVLNQQKAKRDNEVGIHGMEDIFDIKGTYVCLRP